MYKRRKKIKAERVEEMAREVFAMKEARDEDEVKKMVNKWTDMLDKLSERLKKESNY